MPLACNFDRLCLGQVSKTVHRQLLRLPALRRCAQLSPSTDSLGFAIDAHWCTQDAAPAAAKSAPRAEGIDAELDAAHVTWLSGGAAVLLLRSGQMLLASLQTEGGLVRRIQVQRKTVGLVLACSCL